VRTAGSLFQAEQNVATAAVSASRSLALFSYITIVTGRGEAKGRRQSEGASTRLEIFGALVGSVQARTGWTGALETVDASSSGYRMTRLQTVLFEAS
jgi:hypothetical protein